MTNIAKRESKRLRKLKGLDLFFLKNGNDKKARNKPKPKWIALAGTSIKTPKPTIKGKGDAYHN